MFLLELQSQKEMTPLSQLVPRKEGYRVMSMVMTPDAKTTYLNSAVLNTGDLLPSTPGGHNGARHLVAGQGHQVQASIRAPCRYVGIAVVHSKAGDVALQGEALPDLALGDVLHMQAGARGDHQVLLCGPEQE